ncbi:DUF4179 domain-containing protein [Paenibacillus alginolyticus]|uniref:DUF4179 domain-containing protein n=1 Tax=Paenibacillus alginolyticus TaxID=59839 RepID=UPI0004029A16|nr:DUF4179 domain-containing protein [Paenibacillus alginolyticus]MCY9666499.1 DUF4179 domain-containing protein [Paenibacillus alginolyticus]
MKSEDALKLDLERSFDQIHVPESLYQFASELPERFEKGEFANNVELISNTSLAKRFWLESRPVLFKSLAASVILFITLSVSVNLSPAFASWVKDIPILQAITGSWLSNVREIDGVQNALQNGYVPIEPVTLVQDGATFTITDIYMTEERMSFRVLIRSNHLEKYMYPYQMIAKVEGLSPTFATETERDSGKLVDNNSEVMELAYQINLEEEQAKLFLTHNPKELFVRLERIDHVKEMESRTETIISASIPFDKANLLKDRKVDVNAPIMVEPNDPDLKELILKQIQISPTGLKAFLTGKPGISVEVPWKNEAPYFIDDRGTVYHYLWDLDHMEKDKGTSVIPFASSPYFDKNVKTLQLHLPKVIVSEEKPSAQFSLSLNEKFPLTVPYKDRSITIESAQYENGFLHLKMKQNKVTVEDTQNILVQVDGYNMKIANDSNLQSYYRDEVRQNMFKEQAFQNGVEDELYIYAPKQEEYQLTLRRYMDSVLLNKKVVVPIK